MNRQQKADGKSVGCSPVLIISVTATVDCGSISLSSCAGSKICEVQARALHGYYQALDEIDLLL